MGPKSVGKSMPSASAIAGKRDEDGSFCPVHQFVTADGTTPSFAASWTCVIPARSNQYAIRAPMLTAILSARLSKRRKQKTEVLRNASGMMAFSMTTSTKGPKGGYRLVPSWWKREVKAELDRRGRGSRSALALFVPCRTSAVTQLLSEEEDAPETSRIAARVAEWTGIPLPDEAAADEEEGASISELKRLNRIAPELMPQARQIVRSLRSAAEEAKKKDK